jgi:NADPH:quinone reductase
MNRIPTHMQAVAITSFGGPEMLDLSELPVPRPGASEVLIRVTAAGLNHGDLVQRRGNYPPPAGASEVLGLEVSGVVASIGDQVRGWKLGESVCAIVTGGGYAEYCVAPQGQCLRVPSGIKLRDAAALPETFCTVWDAVWGQARLAPGESLLVHGGASGIGTTAIQIARAMGHPVYATAGSAEKCSACDKLGASRSINYRNEDFVEVVREVSDGHGVDVVLDMVGGSYLPRNLQALAMHGRQVSIGVQESSVGTIDIRHMMRRRLTLIGTTLRSRTVAYKSRVCSELAERVWPLLDGGQIRPTVDRVFSMAQVREAHSWMEQGSHTGKILLAIRDSLDD